MMRFFRHVAVGAVAAATLLGTASLAQEVEPPFTWKGKGVGSFIAQDGINEINFNLELAVDVDGNVKGKTVSDEGESTVKHMFFGQRVEHEFPGYYSRKAILVLAINEQGVEPMLAVLNGRLLAGRFFSGEALLKRYEPDSDTDKALGVGNPTATQIEEDYLPSSLKSALKKAMPFGTVKIEGAYQE